MQLAPPGCSSSHGRGGRPGPSAQSAHRLREPGSPAPPSSTSHGETAMLTLTQIFLHTPKWVFVLFATLVWLGAKQLFANSVGLGRVTVMPIVMTALSIFGVTSAFGDSPTALLAW